LLRHIYQRFGFGIRLFLFDFLRTLPKEQIWADGSAKNSNYKGDSVSGFLEAREQSPHRNRRPINIDREYNSYVRKQRKS
jgi:hypothetical protein